MRIKTHMKFVYLLLIITTSIYGEPDHNKNAMSCYSCVFIYQFAKVGSTSLLYMFQPICPTIHTHSPDPIFKKMEEKGRFLIINAMRNIFDRNLSAFFQFLSAGAVENLPKRENYQLTELIEAFPAFNLRLTKSTSKWYSNFNQQFGLHLFHKRFNKYYFERKELYDVLIVRFEDIDQWIEIFEQVLDLQNLTLPLLNERKDPLYQSFRKTYHFSKEEAERMTSIDYMLHFYTKEELLNFKKEYQKGIS